MVYVPVSASMAEQDLHVIARSWDTFACNFRDPTTGQLRSAEDRASYYSAFVDSCELARTEGFSEDDAQY